jgi:hypothetical protein
LLINDGYGFLALDMHEMSINNESMPIEEWCDGHTQSGKEIRSSHHV